MQFLLTQEEIDALKEKRGICPKKFKAASVELREDLLKIVRTVHQYESYAPVIKNPLIEQMRAALDKFDAALQ